MLTTFDRSRAYGEVCPAFPLYISVLLGSCAAAHLWNWEKSMLSKPAVIAVLQSGLV